MVASIESYLKRAKHARASLGNFNYLDEGEYLLQTNSCQYSGDRKPVLAYEGIVLWTTSQSPKMQPGNIIHHATALDSVAIDSFTKTMLMSLNGLTEAEVDSMTDEEFIEAGNLTFTGQSCTGVLLTCDSTTKLSKGKGKTPAGQPVAVRDFRYFGPAGAAWQLNQYGKPELVQTA